MVKLFVGIILGVLIGVACRWFDIPVPSPPKLAGALLVVAMTVGHMVTDRIIATKFSAEHNANRLELLPKPRPVIVFEHKGM